MPCKDVMIADVPRIDPATTVADAFAALNKAGADMAAVVNPDTQAVDGIFASTLVLEELLPVSVDMGGFDSGMHSAMIGAAPGIARRYKNLLSQPVSALLTPTFISVYPDTPLWEAIGLLLSEGHSLPVLDEDGKLHGMVTQAGVFAALAKDKE